MKCLVFLIGLLLFVESSAWAQDSRHKIFATTVSIEANNKPLVECLEVVCDQANAPLKFDPETLRGVNVDMQRLVTIQLQDVTLSTAIAQLLRNNSKSPPLMRGLWKGNIELTTLEKFQARRREMTPDWFGQHTPDFDSEGRIVGVRIHLRNDDVFLDKVLALPAIQRIYVSDGRLLSVESFEKIASCPTILKFEMHGCGLPANERVTWTSDQTLVAIAKSKTIETIIADNCGVSDEALKQLSTMPRLKQLTLRQNQISDEGIKHLAELNTLTSLDLGCYVSSKYGKNTITNNGIKQLSGLRNLERLGLEGTGVSELDLDLPNLRILSMGSGFKNEMRVNDQAIEKLMRYEKLTSLTMSSDLVTNDGIEKVAKLSQLRHIEFRCERVTGLGILHLADLPLESVSLRNVQMTDLGLKGLGKIKTLQRISIYGGLSETSVKGFKQFKGLENLTSLSLAGFSKTENFLGFGELTQLRTLTFEASSYEQEDINQLAERMKDTAIYSGNGARLLSAQRSNEQNN